MNVSISRRQSGCLSDLTIDRWLLGEHAEQEERQLEAHLKGCVGCTARIDSLRHLYDTTPHQARATTARALETAPVATPGESGVLQVIVLRDGLLVGTEYFTPGWWQVGSAPGSDLLLVDGPAAHHGLLIFHGGSVAIEAREGPVLINGTRLSRAEVRSIDELWVGPYVLRVRLITERWSWPAMVAAGPEPRTVVVERPQVQTCLQASVWWGDTQLSTACFERAFSAAALGLDEKVTASRTPDGWVVSPADLSLGLNEATSFDAGALKVVLTVREAQPALPRTRWNDPLFSAVLLLTVLVAVVALVSLPEPPDEDFEARSIPRLPVTVQLKRPPASVPPTAPTPDAPPAISSTRKPTKQQKASPRPPRNRFEALERVMQSTQGVAIALGRVGAATREAKHSRAPLVALPNGAGPKFALNLEDSGAGIGRRGAQQGGQMHEGGYGREGRVGGTVVGPVRPSLTLRPDGGTIDRDAVAKVIAAHLTEVQRCYEASLVLEGSAGGRLAVEWTITPAGSVANARVNSTTLKQASVPQCVLAALKGWVFPKARGGNVVIRYPFVFQSSSYR